MRIVILLALDLGICWAVAQAGGPWAGAIAGAILVRWEFGRALR